jgi:hypothetical protein
VPVPSPPTELPVITSYSEHQEVPASDIEYKPSGGDSPQPFSQVELNDLTRDLGLSKEAAELLGSRLKEKNLLDKGTSFSWYRNREKEFFKYFEEEENLVYGSDVPGLMSKFIITYDKDEWRLFIDSSKRSLKAVLLHHGSQYACIPVGHSVNLKERYENLALILNKIKYADQGWTICGDVKVISMLLGQQGGYTKFPRFICEWDIRDKTQHWVKKEWPKRQNLEPGTKNVIRNNLVNPRKVLLPPFAYQIRCNEAVCQGYSKRWRLFQIPGQKVSRFIRSQVERGNLCWS